MYIRKKASAKIRGQELRERKIAGDRILILILIRYADLINMIYIYTTKSYISAPEKNL